MKKQKNIILIAGAILLGCLFWLLDSFLDYYFFYEGTFWDLFLFNIPYHEIYFRCTIFVFLLLFSLFLIERRKSEEAIKETKDFLDNILESSLDAIIVSDAQGTITRVNTCFLELTGYTEEDIIGQNAIALGPTAEGTYESTTGELVHINDKFFEEAQEMASRLFENLKIFNWESYFISKTKKLIPVEANIVFLQDDDANLIGSVGINRDITERKKSEIRLQKSKEILNEAQHIAHIGSWEYNAITGASYWSNELYQFLGYKSAEVQPTFDLFLDHVHPEDRSMLMDIHNKDIPTSSSRKLEYRIVTETEGIKHVLGQTKFDFDESGNLLRIHGTAQDITERTHAENTIRSAKDFLENVFNTTGEGIIVTDSDGNIRRVNQKAAQMLGYNVEELTGKDFIELSPASLSHESYPPVIEQLLEKEFIENYQTRYRRKDGSVFSAEINITLLKDNEGKMNGGVCSIRDITERKRIEAEKNRIADELRNNIRELSFKNEIGEILLSTRELDEVLHMILVGATSPQGLGFNRAFLYLLNEEKNRLEGKTAIGSLGSDEAHKNRDRLKQENCSIAELIEILQEHCSDEDEPINTLVKQIYLPLGEKESIFTRAVNESMTFNIKDGATTSHIDKEIIGRLEMDSFALVPLVSKDRNLGILVADNFSSKKSIHDEDVERLRAFANHVSLAIENSRLYKSLKQTVEELQSAYAELQQNRDKLIRSERLSAVGMVAAQVAHDIRNPMTIIGGFARRIFKQSKSGFNKINIGHIQIIINEIERLENILNDLLSYTSPEVPHGDLVDLNSLVKSTCEMYAPMMEQNNVTLEEQLDPNLPELVLDEDLIKRATINIIKNSIEAMPDGGSITVATGIDNQCARIEISDRGEGVDKDNTDKLFEPFFTTKAKGTGLGLTISDQIIRSHGGTIEVLKRKEKGVSVIFQLPVTTSVEHIERIKS